MSKFSYSTEIGAYGEDVRLSISLDVKQGVDEADYTTLRSAFAMIEKIAYKYQTEATEAGSPTDSQAKDELNES